MPDLDIGGLTNRLNERPLLGPAASSSNVCKEGA
jgi:hypothetical protein